MTQVYVAQFVAALFRFFEILLVIWCILSWIPRRSGGVIDDIAAAIDRIVHPYVGLFQRFVPPIAGIDFSPIIAVFVLDIIERVVLRLILSL